MNWKKKALCAAAILAMVPHTVLTAAKADELSEDSTFTVTVFEQTEGHTYEAYRIFKARTADDGTLADIDWGEGISKEGFLAAITNDSFAYAQQFAGKTTAAEIAGVISENRNDADFVREISALIWKNKGTVAADQDPSGVVMTLTGGGYYLAVDTTDLSGADDSNSGLMLFTSKDNLQIEPKISNPSLTKSIVTNSDETDFQDYAVNDVVTYQLKATLPDNYMEYETYELHFYDEAEGLIFDSGSFSVTADGQPVLVIPEVHETSFTIDIPDLKSLIADDLSGKTVVVQYSGTVTEEAIMGSEGNCNSANIRYSNNPHGTQTGQSGNEFVPFFTYQVEVDKVDENDQPLSGASFILERKNEDGSYSPVSDAIMSSDGTVFTFERISAGDYRLTEITAPAGYNLMDPVLFTVTAEYTMTRASMPQIDLKLTDSEGNVTEGNPDDGRMVLKAVNIKGVILPSTGGPGTAMLYGSGVVLLLASLLILQRKHEKE